MIGAEDNYKKALENHKIPILTLDNMWHQLFGQARITPELKELEEQINDLLKKQGRLNTDIKKCKALKKKLMDEIVSLTDEFQETQNAKINAEIETHKRIMDECNQKMEDMNDAMKSIPMEMEQLNRNLMLLTMDICRERFQNNTEEIEEIETWLSGIKEELKTKVIQKQKKEVDNYGMYMFMSEFFGAETMSLFEMKYNPGDAPPKKKEKG